MTTSPQNSPHPDSTNLPRHRRLARVSGRVLILATLAAATLTVGEQSTLEPATHAGSFNARDSFSSAASRSEQRAALSPEMTVTVADTTTESLTTRAGTVREVLLGRDVILGELDFVTPDLNTPVSDAMAITITRVSEATLTETATVAHTSRTEPDPSRYEGTQTVTQQGADGQTNSVYTVRVDPAGNELSRELLLSVEVSAPIEHVVAAGTKVKPAPAAPTSPSGTAPASGPVASGSNRAIGKELAAARGWGDDQFACLDALWTKESGWNHTAKNKSSGAYGIPQSLPGNKMASVAGDWETNPATQVTWGLNYISGRYSTPCGAWAASQAKGWY